MVHQYEFPTKMRNSKTHSFTLAVKPLVKTCLTQASWGDWPAGVTVYENQSMPQAEDDLVTSHTVGAAEAVSNNIRGASRGKRDFLGHIVGCHGSGCKSEEELKMHFGNV
jgi:hypothetical protein